MKRTHFTLMFLLIGLSAYGQATTSTGLSGSFTSGNHIAVDRLTKLSFNPQVGSDTLYHDFKAYFFDHFNGTENTYDCWVSQWAFQSYKAKKIVDVAVMWNGVRTEYTFEEFKKYLWP